MRVHRAVPIFLLVLSLCAEAGPRRRAVGKSPSHDESTPAGWLAAHAFVLTTSELVPYTDDLQPLRAMIGDADVVGLGDGTHGTREFYRVKLRLIDLLVREMGFDVVAFEGSFPLMNRLNAYVQSGVGNPQEIVHALHDVYYFWDTAEMLEVVDWMREYNAHRGDRPAVHIAGFDVMEPFAASRAVLSYLRKVDSALWATAAEQYRCLSEETVFASTPCRRAAMEVRDALATREPELTALSSSIEFHEALQNARVITQNDLPLGASRDIAMAENVGWLRAHRGATGKIILWAHNIHLAKTAHPWQTPPSLGNAMRESLGDQYFALGTLTAAGSFLIWDFQSRRTLTATFPPLAANAYETYLRQSGQPLLLIPLRGTLPAWLTTPAPMNSAGNTGVLPLSASLSLLYDAAIYIDTTKATRHAPPR